MAHNTRAKALWADGDVPTAAQFNIIEDNAAEAINGDDGGVWAPAAAIEIGGSGIKQQAPFVLESAGRIVPSVATGADADSTITVGGANTVIRLTSTITANRVYTLSASGAATNDVLTFYSESSLGTSNYVIVLDQAAAQLYILGNGNDADGQWASFIYIGGWRLLQSPMSRLRRNAFTSNGTWTCPPNVYFVRVVGCGGGGGGAGGAGGGAANEYARGGGGGSGALLGEVTVAVTPGVTYNVTIGAGGAYGAGGFSGSNGASTTFDSLATFRPGFGGRAYTTLTISATVSRGGGRFNPGSVTGEDNTTSFPGLSDGGPGGTYAVLSKAGGDNLEYAGGTAGASAANDGFYYGGGGGGGGGAGPFGAGANGAAGDAGNSAGFGADGFSASHASANTGAGGGGGGGGGGGLSGGGNGGDGSNGGSGRLYVYWVK